MKQTAVQQIIEKFEYIKENHCKSLQEVVFFDGILAVIESGEYKAIEKEQIKDAHINGFYSPPFRKSRNGEAEEYYNENFKSE